jgi:hypothetical protein
MAAGNLLAFSQVTSTSSISGAVVDPTGAVVAGATISVRNEATGEESRATSAGNGTFTVPALTAGVYKIVVSAAGFKQALMQGVKIDAGVPATVNVSLEIGAATDSVVVQSNAEVLQTQSANISTTITGRQITDLPFTSRNATDLLLFQPGTVTPGRPRSSSFNGLPQGAINMTLDGLNIQDNAIKNGDGFYTNFYPRTDAVQEVTLSTATPGAESAGEGAVQIKMVTRYGGNAFHGSVYEYHRNPVLNANYWFNNRDLQPPKDRLLLNQFGGRFEGPIVIPKLFNGHDKAFFFVNYEQFRLATQVSQNRNILSQRAQQGFFQWKVKQQDGQTVIRERNLLDLVATSNCAPAGQPARPCGVSTIDPTIAKLLGDIRSATQTSGAVEVVTDPSIIADPNIQRYSFSPVGGGEIRIFPTLRLDFNLGSKHHLEGSYLPQTHHTLIDYLNNGAPAFPGFPSFGSQISTRFGSAIALRSTLTNTLANEARFTFSGGTVTFNSESSAANYTGAVANQAGFNLGINAAGISNATVSTNIQRRNAPIKQFSDTVNWVRGSHTLNFGANFTQVNYFQSLQTFAPQITFGVDTTDPARSLFSTTTLQGASDTDVANARGLYATLVGSIATITANSFLDEETGKYVYNGLRVRRARMRELGLFTQDGWRVKPNLTLNYGLRWEVQLSVVPKNNNLSTTTVAGLYGVSGLGGPTQFTQFKEGDKAFNTNLGNFAPSLGFAWTPNWKSGLLSKVFGSDGKSVIRGGFSIAYNREGISDILDTLVNNPGGQLTSTRSVTNNNLGSLPVLLSQTSRLGPPVVPDSPVYPITNQQGGYLISDAASIYDPNYKLPYVMSWSFGLQREITKDMAIEVRYVGNRGLRNRKTYNLNDINIVDNGFLNEFKLAQANLIANEKAGRRACPVAPRPDGSCSQPLAPTFKYFGPNTGTSPLPTTLAYFSGIPAADAGTASKYTSTLFTNTTFVNPLVVNNAAPFTFAQSLYNNTGQRNNALAAGLPANFFLVNPNLQGGASFTGNGGHTYYDSAVVELRRRMSKGLLVQGSYVYARGFTLNNTSVRSPYFKTLSPLVINHAFKADWIYDLPFGHGQSLLGNAKGVIGKAVEGWSFQGGARLQSGAPVVFNGFQTNAPGDTLPNGLTGLRLVGMTAKDLQKAVKMRFDDTAKVAYFLPQDIIDNTIKAFSVSATSATGYGSLGAPTGRYIAPANRADCVESYAGQCGFPNLVLYGPSFTRFDLSMIKRTKITEKVDFEFRAEFLNAFNNINFSIQNPSNATTTIRGNAGANGLPAGVANSNFGRVGFAYRDISTTNDPGGRIIQFVGRINF